MKWLLLLFILFYCCELHTEQEGHNTVSDPDTTDYIDYRQELFGLWATKSDLIEREFFLNFNFGYEKIEDTVFDIEFRIDSSEIRYLRNATSFRDTISYNLINDSTMNIMGMRNVIDSFIQYHRICKNHPLILGKWILDSADCTEEYYLEDTIEFLENPVGIIDNTEYPINLLTENSDSIMHNVEFRAHNEILIRRYGVFVKGYRSQYYNIIPDSLSLIVKLRNNYEYKKYKKVF